jgi:hypothetical protein
MDTCIDEMEALYLNVIEGSPVKGAVPKTVSGKLLQGIHGSEPEEEKIPLTRVS